MSRARAPRAPRGPLVSIVTPSLNQGRFIKATIESVLAQDYGNLEYLVQDGGSTDGTLEILNGYGSRVDWVSEPDRCQVDAIAKGFARSRGQILAWVNSDDLLRPGAVSAAVAAFADDPSLGMVYAGADLIDRDGRVFARHAPPLHDLWTLVNLCCQICQPSCYFRRDAYQGVGGLDESLRWTMDYDLFIRIGLRYRSALVDGTWSAFRIYDDTLTMTGGLPRYRELLRVVRAHSDRRFPPAYLHFLAETIAYSRSRVVRSISNPSIALPLASRVERAGYALAAAIDRAVTTRWSDGWVGPDARMLLPPGGRHTLLLRGDVPGSFFLGSPAQHLLVSLAGRPLAEVDLDSGPFEVALDLAPGRSRLPGRAVELRVRATESFVPARHGFDGDRRRVAWMWPELRWGR